MLLIQDGSTAVITTALHAGHRLRPEVAAIIALDEATRLREEDPHTDVIADIGVSRIVAHDSRFQVDLNRARSEAVYLAPEQAWGLDLWLGTPSSELVRESREAHDAFYAAAARLLDAAAELHGGFVVLDVHSYNHRRGGPDAPPASDLTDPEVNLGTASLNRGVFGQVARTFTDVMVAQGYDTRENVKFRGGHFAQWVNERYDAVGCALAIEFKKTFMDEWTGIADPAALERARTALAVAAARIEPLVTGSDR